ncbi:unnamed protein product [Rhizoctonia solani]|uniref:Uncharacterized protein n=1 Tax=Rhizoctonia solani TaxID=456999 RepID=A0A8H3BET1_9AGAM|nr:unnamed protein product [Rhizoctonia solani]
MPMAQTHTKNKRSIARKAPIQVAPKQDRSYTSPFPEYIEHKDGLYRCLLCKDHTLERHMWLGRGGILQHQKRGMRHRQLVKEWEATRDGLKATKREREESELSILDEIGVSEITEEQAESENSSAVGDPESSPEPVVEESKTPALYYPTISWDEPVQQGVRVAFDDLENISRKSETPVPQITAPEVKKELEKLDDKSSQNSACEYGSIKTNGYYTCTWCQLPYTPQRKYRRCKRAVSIRCEESAVLIRESTPLTDRPSLEYPDIKDSEPEGFILGYVLDSE